MTASADFAVTLADVDSSPASLLETMASGVPLVVGLAPSMDEWIQQGEGGELVEDRHDVDAVAAAMVRLARDAELRRTLRRAEPARGTRALRRPDRAARAGLPRGRSADELAHVPAAALAREPSARREGQYMRYDQAARAPDPAASVVSPSRSPAPPGGSEGRPGT